MGNNCFKGRKRSNKTNSTKTTTIAVHDNGNDNYYHRVPSSSSLLLLSTQSNNNDTTTIQSMQRNNNNNSSLSLGTWDGEKSLHYWFSIVLIQGVVQLPLWNLKEYTLVCKSISKLARDYIQRNFYFRQHDHPNYLFEKHDPENRYLWYSPCCFKNVKDLSTLPINTTEIQFYPTFNSPFTFPIYLQQVTHITFEYTFNQPLGCGIKSEINNLPLTLTHLTLSADFNQPIHDLPPNLTKLVLGNSFNRNVDHLPPNLKILECGYAFNNHVDSLPPKLTHLKFSEHFNKPINMLPLSLTHLAFFNYDQAGYFKQPISQLQRNFESNLVYLILSTSLVQRYESSIPLNFMRLGESKQYKYHMVYKRKQQQQQVTKVNKQ